MAKQIIVMSDGEMWESLEEHSTAAVWTITDAAYELLISGVGYPKHLAPKDIRRCDRVAALAEWPNAPTV